MCTESLSLEAISAEVDLEENADKQVAKNESLALEILDRVGWSHYSLHCARTNYRRLTCGIFLKKKLTP